ncbi:uncharacterized protein LOC116303407 [Actinia tenebrosa]|uniref:Uncharacterized protein LOC116303407 n=1 Tax=Actinia tenebrosa TaxID=6105 RepID=A0A6P8IPK7_ACTTE|nr:uncharacterized protein LOC116303407 [Actinia tenebrosa]
MTRNFSQLSVDYENLTNLTSRSSTRTYVNSPTSDQNLVILSVTLSLIALLGTLSNSVVVIMTKRESRYEGPIEEMRRRSLVSYFIYNLSLSDLLGSLFSCPSLIIQQYVASLQTKIGCSIVRLVSYAFPTLSTQILAVICLERYMNLVFPFRSFPMVLTRRMVKCAWGFTAFWSLAISFTFSVNIIEVQGNFYVFQCALDLEDPTKKAFYMTSLFFTFVLPLIIICFSTIRSAIVITKLKCGCKPNPSAKVRSTWLVIWLVVIFGATSFPFAVYQGIKSFNGQIVDPSTDFIILYVCAILVFSNGVVNTFMYYKNMKSMKQKIDGLFGRRSPMKPNTVNLAMTFENVTYKPESLLRVPSVSLFEGRFDSVHGATLEQRLNTSLEMPIKTDEERSFSHVQLSVPKCPLQVVSVH